MTDRKKQSRHRQAARWISREMGDEYDRKSKSDPADIRWQMDDERLVRAE
jgi:hypothetical protein